MASPGPEQRHQTESSSYDEIVISALRLLTPAQRQVVEELWRLRGYDDLQSCLREQFGREVVDPVLAAVNDLQQRLGWTYRFVINNLKLYLPAVTNLPPPAAL